MSHGPWDNYEQHARMMANTTDPRVITVFCIDLFAINECSPQKQNKHIHEKLKGHGGMRRTRRTVDETRELRRIHFMYAKSHGDISCVCLFGRYIFILWIGDFHQR